MEKPHEYKDCACEDCSEWMSNHIKYLENELEKTRAELHLVKDWHKTELADNFKLLEELEEVKAERDTYKQQWLAAAEQNYCTICGKILKGGNND